MRAGFTRPRLDPRGRRSTARAFTRPGAFFATRWDDMDAYGHVNNTVHYQWFDSAVNCWWSNRDCRRGAWQSDRLGSETPASFRAARLSRTRSTWECRREYRPSSVRYRIGIFRAGRGASIGRRASSSMSMSIGQTRRPIAIPDAWRATRETNRLGADPRFASAYSRPIARPCSAVGATLSTAPMPPTRFPRYRAMLGPLADSKSSLRDRRGEIIGVENPRRPPIRADNCRGCR